MRNIERRLAGVESRLQPPEKLVGRLEIHWRDAWPAYKDAPGIGAVQRARADLRCPGQSNPKSGALRDHHGWTVARGVIEIVRTAESS
jgi:hypothetical protein